MKSNTTIVLRLAYDYHPVTSEGAYVPFKIFFPHFRIYIKIKLWSDCNYANWCFCITFMPRRTSLRRHEKLK